ncbi:SDR family NAD(P)-dependent oxidoreductase [Streptomyces sp. NPDC019990]|uniref:SDR family NAD(P)-dependent oxidoreductase n=1 Tax=Streptomyces sp. NPDC019990 TaxID=3154693 RepID=UPI0033D53E1D
MPSPDAASPAPAQQPRCQVFQAHSRPALLLACTRPSSPHARPRRRRCRKAQNSADGTRRRPVGRGTWWWTTRQPTPPEDRRPRRRSREGVHSAGKGAVQALTAAAAVELAPYDVRVAAVAPGMTRTPLLEADSIALPADGDRTAQQPAHPREESCPTRTRPSWPVPRSGAPRPTSRPSWDAS